MASIRAKLTTAYAVALIASVMVFALALWGARRATVYQRLAAHVLSQADVAVSLVREVGESGEPLTLVSDSLVGPVVTPRLFRLLAAVPKYLLVFGDSGRVLF